MAGDFRVGENVRWKWGDGYGEGKITERFNDKVTRTIDGTDVTRNASDEEPAFLIEQNDGDRVLKSQSEIQKAD